MYPDKATYDKVNAYHIEFRTGALTSLHVPDIVDYYSDMDPDMVLKCIILGNACVGRAMTWLVDIMKDIEKHSSSERE